MCTLSATLLENAQLRAENNVLRCENARLMKCHTPLKEDAMARICFDSTFLRDALLEAESQLASQLEMIAQLAEEACQAAVRQATVVAELPGADLMSDNSMNAHNAALLWRSALEAQMQVSTQAMLADLHETEVLLAAEQRLTIRQAEQVREAAAREAAVMAEMPAMELQAIRSAAQANEQATGSILDQGARRYERGSTTGGTHSSETEITTSFTTN